MPTKWVRLYATARVSLGRYSPGCGLLCACSRAQHMLGLQDGAHQSCSWRVIERVWMQRFPHPPP